MRPRHSPLEVVDFRAIETNFAPVNIKTRITRSRKSRGFTITELLVAIAIIVVLAAISFSVVSKSRKKAASVSCLQNLRDWSAVFAQASADYSNRLPTPGNWAKIQNNQYNPDDGSGRSPFVNYWADNDDQRFEIQLQKRGCPCLNPGLTPGGNPAPTYMFNRMLSNQSNQMFVILGQVRRASQKIIFVDGNIGSPLSLTAVGQVNSEMVPAAEPHGGSVNAVFADLSVRPIKPADVRNDWQLHTQRER